MSWYVKLKDIFKDVFPALQSLVTINVTVNSNNSSQKTEYNPSSQIFTINLDKLTPAEIKAVKGCLLEAKNEGNMLLDKHSAEVVQDFKKIDSTSDTKDTLGFLTQIIPPGDIKIWRAALYIRSQYQQSKDIQQLKLDVMAKYGEKGKNIVNLCTAGYIETLFAPNYKFLKDNHTDEAVIKEHFEALYELVVYELAVTVFVYLTMKDAEVKDQIIKKIEQNLKYGIKFLNIHGIGKANVDKINEALSVLDNVCKSKGISITNKSVKQEKNTILVRLEF